MTPVCKVDSDLAQKTLKECKNFEFQAEIGKGTYGRVFRAVHKATQKIYAIKVIDKDFVSKVRPFIFIIYRQESSMKYPMRESC
jgi:serine/threonine protein kinase